MEEKRMNGMKLERLSSSEMQIRGGAIDIKRVFETIKVVVSFVIEYLSDFLNGYKAGKKAK